MSQQKKQAKSAKRTRLDPAVRKQMILDTAANLIATEGMSAVSMERLGREAGISKSLVYTYYPTLQLLLQTLLRQEYQNLRSLQIQAAEAADSIESLVQKITSTYMTYMTERGLILERLAAEPSVAGEADPTEYNRDSAVNYLADIIHRDYDLELPLAKAVVDISFGLPAAGGHYLVRHDLDQKTVEDITATMILGSIQAVRDKFAQRR
ncbi:MAG: TetR/AcrR family transcriptional regulator [Pseudomonadales bacterium]